VVLNHACQPVTASIILAQNVVSRYISRWAKVSYQCKTKSSRCFKGGASKHGPQLPIGDAMHDSDLIARLETAATEAVAALRRRRPASDDWVSAFVDGDAIGTDEAAYIWDCVPETVRRRAEAAAGTDHPLGIWFAQSVWLISKARLFDAIEVREGLSGRLAAVSRATKYTEMRAQPQLLSRFKRAATG
jgi:hypothetical protein